MYRDMLDRIFEAGRGLFHREQKGEVGQLRSARQNEQRQAQAADDERCDYLLLSTFREGPVLGRIAVDKMALQLDGIYPYRRARNALSRNVQADFVETGFRKPTHLRGDTVECNPLEADCRLSRSGEDRLASLTSAFASRIA